MYQEALRRRSIDRAQPPTPARHPLTLTDADKYRWIRANRHSLELVEALHNAGHDADFDALIETAMRMSVASPSYFGALGELPEPA
jgi:hypothetical protein